MRKDLDDSFDRALEMISMVEELLQKDLNKELSAKANQGLSATLKIARDMLKSNESSQGSSSEFVEQDLNEDIHASLAYEAKTSKKINRPSRKNRRAPVIHMTRKALNLG
jgi:hypothetical protein